MKLRITIGRIVCAVVLLLLPVLYVFSIGPALYCVRHYGLSRTTVAVVYFPAYSVVRQTPMAESYYDYLRWWSRL